MSSVESPMHGSLSDMSSLGNGSLPSARIITSSSNKASSSVLDAIPIPIRRFHDDDDDEDDVVGDMVIDVDAPISAEDQNLLNQITDFESSETELESVSKDRRDLLASPLLMAALTAEKAANGPTTSAASTTNPYRNKPEPLSWDQDKAAQFFAAQLGQTTTVNSLQQENQLDGGTRPELNGGGGVDSNQAAATAPKPTNPYRRTEIWVAAAIVVIAVIAIGIAVPLIKNSKQNSKSVTSRPTLPPISGVRTFTPSVDPLAPPTQIGTPSHQTSEPILSSPSLSTSLPSGSFNSKSPTQIPLRSGSPSSTIQSSPPTQSPSTATSSPIIITTASPSLSSPTSTNNSSSPSHTPSIFVRTSSPTIVKTLLPTKTATISLTSSPTPAKSPTTANPSFSPLQSQRRGDITALLFQISGVFVFLNKNSPQSRAYQWILNFDPMQLLASDLPAIVQRYTLATLYFSTNANNTWLKCGLQGSDSPCPSEKLRFLSNASECDWYGVGCNDTTITSLDFRRNGMRGPLPSELSTLSLLTQLTFSRNSLSSTIPSTLSRLKYLRNLFLNRNNLTGTIPSVLGLLNSIQYLHLGSNHITGTIPSEIFARSLQNLDLGTNQLHGTIPDFVLLSPDLINIDLSKNILTGPMLDFGKLSSLNYLALNNNFLFGNISSSTISAVTNVLTVQGNNVSGTISDDFFDQGKSLTLLNLGNNTIKGTLSTRFGELSNLAQLVLWNNQFSGTIPSELGELRSLGNLELAGNKLRGTMPPEVCELRSGQLTVLSSDCGESSAINCSCCSLCL